MTLVTRTTLSFRFHQETQSATDKTWLFWDESPDAHYHSVSLIKVSAPAATGAGRAIAHENAQTYFQENTEGPLQYRSAVAELDPDTYDVLRNALKNQPRDVIVTLTDWGDPYKVGPWSIEIRLA